MTRPCALIILALAGCATPSVRDEFDLVQADVAERTSLSPAWPADHDERDRVQARVDELLAQPLTPRTASEIALLNSPRLRAAYARLGVSRAELLEAEALANPQLSIDAGFPDRPPSITQLDFGLTVNLLRILAMPARRDMARAQLDATTLSVASDVLATATEARTALLDLQASEQMASILTTIVQAEQARRDLARKLHEAGNISDLDLARLESVVEAALLERAHARRQAAERHEQVNALLGLWGDRTRWTVQPKLDDLPPDEPPLDTLETLAIRQRLDLAAAAKEVEVLAQGLGIQRSWRGILSADVGVIAERDTDGQWVFGPELSIELPIFNQGQAGRARLEAELAGAQARLEALAIETRADVRRLRDRLVSLRYEAAHLHDTVVPLNERITALTLKEYNYMLVDTFALLDAKRQEIEAYRSVIDVTHDYWVTRARLEQAVGGRLLQEGQ